MVTPLIIYKASAGSGKTFTLATEYIKLVVRNPQAYRKILAVTFTNKATEEMKMRILSQLYGIWKDLPSSKDYMKVVCKDLGETPAFVSERAGIALSNLLHNYSYFRITTIDSFFQSVLRNLARELNLTANLRLGMNDKQVEELAVDELIDNLSARNQMLKWILNYIMDTINDDNSWNVIDKVKSFGTTIFEDEYKAERDHLHDITSEPKFYENYSANLRDIQREALEKTKSIGNDFLKALKDEGLECGNLSYGEKGVAGLFLKMREGVMDGKPISDRVKGCLDAPEKWHKKDDPKKDLIEALVCSRLNDLLKEAIELYPQQYKRYQSAELTLKHLYQLRLLESIAEKVMQLNKDANRFLLSDTQQMLHTIIKDTDSPFIFEKIGAQLEHIMIDEFQDTSTVQWKNFKVLLQETMSHEGTENLIVGDVKQSIYRWRSGDWRLLGNIQKEFDQPEKQLTITPLKNNWRSYRNIIAFNNAFFKEAASFEGISAYDDVEQLIPEKRGDEGFVSLTLYPQDKYPQNMLENMASQVKELINNGVSMTEIAILVRANRQIPVIANYFMEYLPEVSVVSDEAFRLDASPAIQIIIQGLRFLNRPNDLIAKAFLTKACSNLPLHEGNIDEKLPKEMTEGREDLLRLPLYELNERLCSIFRLNEMEGQASYLCAFYDQVATFVNEQMSDIASFLKEWDETICSKTIQSPDINGIRIISIHKSKGLEFPYVFIPYCDWKLEQGTTVWCRPKEEPFNQLPIVPIDYSSKMMGTIYEEDYNEENQQNKTDNMNLLYVAFTRAEKALYILGKRGEKSARSNTIEEVIPQVAEVLGNTLTEGLEDKNATLHFEYGTKPSVVMPKADTKEKEGKENVFLKESTTVPLSIDVFKQKVEFKQSNLSQQFAADDDEQQQMNYIQLGSVLHQVFSTIRTKADINSALQRMELEGILYDKNLTKEKIEALIRKRLGHPQVAYWYDEKWKLFNECTILNIDPHTGAVYERRPDRVMTDGKEMIVIDFKFGRPNNDYRDQVKEYMNLLSDMGHKNIKGYLWYVYSNIIDEIK